MPLQELTFTGVIGALLVILLFIDVYVKIMSAVKTYREEKKRKDAPVSNIEETVKGHEEKLRKDHERLNRLEEAIRVLMRSQIAQLDHEISGNSVEKLRESKNEIQQFLIDK